MDRVLPQEIRKLAAVIEEKDNQIQALVATNEVHQRKILRLSEEIDDLIKNRLVSRRGYFDNVLCFIKKKNIKNVLNFVTQTWRRLAGVMIQILFIDGTYSNVK